MKKCFDFIIHIYDDNDEKRYYGTGEIVAEEGVIDGYVCNDYMKFVKKEKMYEFEFHNYDVDIQINTEINADQLEFPGKFAIVIPKECGVSLIYLEVSSEVKDFKRCQKIKETLDTVKSLYYA